MVCFPKSGHILSFGFICPIYIYVSESYHKTSAYGNTYVCNNYVAMLTIAISFMWLVIVHKRVSRLDVFELH